MRFRFILGQMGRGLRENKAMGLSLVLVSFISLLFVGSAVLLQNQVRTVQSQWYENIQVSVYMCPAQSNSPLCNEGEATQEQIDDVRSELEKGDAARVIDKITFESKEQALDKFKNLMEGTAWVNALTQEQMQASFRITLTNPEEYEEVTKAVTGMPGVEEVDDQSEQIDPIFTLLNRLTLMSAGLAVVMIVVALMLIPTMIRLSAMSRKNETEIMRYVGASNFFIEFPFILEGMLASFIGAILASLSLFLGVKYFVGDWLASSLTWMRVISTADVLWLMPVLIIGAVAISGFTSWISIRRYASV